jgi:hypothetical protein
VGQSRGSMYMLSGVSTLLVAAERPLHQPG